jgi:geranylgeranylglycerol-phosphate geranylgeranyltransferase
MFVPAYTHAHDLGRSLAVAAPIFLISMCTFILNDLHDVEADRINHPHRPLPSKVITQRSAAIAYITVLVASLALIRALTTPTQHYLYLTVLLVATNYSVVVSFIPELKTIYVAGTVTLALMLVCGIAGSGIDITLLSSAFLFILGRELLMDVQDLEGDGRTFAKWFTPGKTTFVAFGLQGVSTLMLLLIAKATLETAAASTNAVLLFIVISEWWNEKRRRRLLQVMQFQMLAAIVFLA